MEESHSAMSAWYVATLQTFLSASQLLKSRMHGVDQQTKLNQKLSSKNNDAIM